MPAVVTPHRVVSLLPSATEMVCALGAGAKLVGRSHECDFPADVAHLPVCTRPNLNSNATSGEIDRKIKSLLHDALSIYSIDTGSLRALRPDLILTQAQCEVCAVSLPEVEKAVAEWAESPPRLISLSPLRLADLWKDISAVAASLNAVSEGRDLVRRLKSRVADVLEKSVPVKRRPSVACIEWMDPLMAAGNWVPELVELAGGLNLFGEAGKHSPWLSWEAVQEHDPEILLVMPCGFGIERIRQEMSALTNLPDWTKLRAVRRGQVYLTDGNQFFNRPGPRLVDSLEILAEIIHPKTFSFGQRGKGWIRLE